MHDGRTAVMRYAVLANSIKNCFCVNPTQAHVNARPGRHSPGKTPAIAVKHGQRPQINRVFRQIPFQDIRHRIERRTPVVVNHALGVSGGAAGVVERNGVPFIGRQLPGKVGVTFGNEVVVINAANAFTLMRRLDAELLVVNSILHINHQQRLG